VRLDDDRAGRPGIGATDTADHLKSFVRLARRKNACLVSHHILKRGLSYLKLSM
jgi:hypothetical protein